jgi:hypothetical protein
MCSQPTDRQKGIKRMTASPGYQKANAEKAKSHPIQRHPSTQLRHLSKRQRNLCAVT